MKRLLLIWFIFTVTVSQEANDFRLFKRRFPLKRFKTSADRILEHGYPAESYFVETKDGYLLNVFRIPYSPKLNNKNETKPIVFLQHGLMSCSDAFLLNGPDDAIAFNFANNGFDVWLGNSRGNIYSHNNTKISLDHPDFWAFSWHEMGNIDVPETIDYILNKTGQTQLHYVGHSQGCTVFFVMTSTRPEYNLKIKTAHMLAPAVFMGNTTNRFLVEVAAIAGKPGKASSFLDNQELLPYNPILQRLVDTACGNSFFVDNICSTLILLLGGPQNENLNRTLLPQVTETHPAGISTNQLIHFAQEYNSNEFRQYDHGRKKNIHKYGKPEPPRYQIERITSNMYIYYSITDTATHYKDVKRLEDILPNLKMFYQVPYRNWSHLDFAFSNRVKEVINDPVIGLCKEYEEKTESR